MYGTNTIYHKKTCLEFKLLINNFLLVLNLEKIFLKTVSTSIKAHGKYWHKLLVIKNKQLLWYDVVGQLINR